jgi:NAD-dependent deacetylase
MKDSSYICSVEGDLNVGDLCPSGGQLRPHIVFFGEEVSLMDRAIEIVSMADIVVVAGTSLAVYPAAGLLSYAPKGAKIYVIDPEYVDIGDKKVKYIRKRFSIGMPQLAQELIDSEA